MSLIPKDHIYSYSQLSGFDECPFSYYLQRIEGAEDLPNAFAEHGSLIHDILDKWAKKQLTKEQMVEEYERRYPNEVVTAFPRMLASKGYNQKAYQLGVDYFTDFDEFAGYEVISAEEEFKEPLPLADGTERPFIAYVDLVLRDKFTGSLIICDHKSKSVQAFKKAEDDMYKQQYIYSYFVHKKYNEWPKYLMFNLFKENGKRFSREFDMKIYESVIQWATDQIHKIESYDVLDWLECKEQDFFCTEICGMRKQCPNGVMKKKGKKK